MEAPNKETAYYLICGDILGCHQILYPESTPVSRLEAILGGLLRYSSLQFVFFCFLTLVLLSACSSEKQQGASYDSTHKGIALPEKIATFTLNVASDSIIAYVTIDTDPTRYKMVLDLSTNKMRAVDIPVSFGAHIIRIHFEYQYIGYESPLVLATADINTTISKDATSLTAQENNYNYEYDEDNDGFTNIRELNDSNGPTDPTDPNSKPFVDDIVPTVTVLPLGGSTVYTTAQPIEIICADGSNGSGCDAIYYSLDGAVTPQATPDFLYSTPFTLVKNTLLSYFATDRFGNSSEIQTQQYNFNIIGPTVTATPRGSIYQTRQTVQLLCDGVCAKIFYTTDGSEPNTSSIIYNGAFTIVDSLTLKYFSIDANQVAGPTLTDFFTIDLFSPVTTATGYKPNCNQSTSDCVVYSQSPVAVELFCNDDINGSVGSGCANTFVGNNQPTAPNNYIYGNQINVASTTDLYFYSVDAAGRAEAPINQQRYVIDNSKPTTIRVPATEVSNGNINVTLSCDDGVNSAGCEKLVYTLDGSEPDVNGGGSTIVVDMISVSSTSIIITNSLTLKYYAIDKAGNPEATQLATYIIENQSPVTSASILASAGPFNSTVIVTLSCADLPASNNSGCAILNYIINDIADSYIPTATNPSIDITINSTTTLTYFSVDNAGNREVQKPASPSLQIYLVDTVVPLVSVDVVGGTYASTQTVKVFCDDGSNGSGCREISYTLVTNSGGTTTQIYDPSHTNPINITSSSTLTISVVDLAGNVAIRTEIYNINIPPLVSNPVLVFENRNGNDFNLTWVPATDKSTPQLQLQYQLYHSSSNNLDTVANVLTNGTAYGGWSTKIISNNTITEIVTGVSNSLNSYWAVLVQDEQRNQSIYPAALPNGLGFLALLDKDFDTDGIVVKDSIGGGVGWDTTKAIIIDAQDRIVAVGESFDANNSVIMTLMRFLPGSGQLDTSFNSPQGFITFPSPSRGQAVTIDSQNRIIVTGTIDNKMTVWRFSDVGILDTTGFNNPLGYITAAPVGTWSYGNAVSTYGLNNIMVVGSVYDFSTYVMSMWQIDIDGNLGFSVIDNQAGSQIAYGMVIDEAANRMAITGNSGTTTTNMAIWMYDLAGNLDPAFANGGLVTFPPAISGNRSDGYAIVFDPTKNKLIVAGSITDTATKMTLWRFDLVNSTWDTTFNTTGNVSFNDISTTSGQSLVLDTSSVPYKLLVTGRVSITNSLDMITWRYLSNGFPDTSFTGTQHYIIHNSAAGGNRNDWGNGIAIDSIGRIVIGGQSESAANNDMAIWRYR